MICLLKDRSLVRVSGVDAESFLQNLVTNDVVHLEKGQLVYACLLTPQGRFLHDLFISRTDGGFFLECETARREDLIRRLNIFKMRAKVLIEDCNAYFDIYATDGKDGMEDPRLPELGCRRYFPAGEKVETTVSPEAYKDRRISLGVPEGSAEIRPEVDTIFDANLDKLNAVSWDKGCYVGQEVTARMNNRNLIKKRMVVVEGALSKAGDSLMQDGHVMGEIRVLNSAGNQGLAVVKVAGMQQGQMTLSSGAIISAHPLSKNT